MTNESSLPANVGSNDGLGVTVPERDRWSERYQVVRRGFWWRVKIGDGEQTVGRCYTETSNHTSLHRMTRRSIPLVT